MLSQRVKTIQKIGRAMSAWSRYHAFPWDTNEQWKLYYNNLTIPETASEKQRQVILNKYKRKYYSQKVEALPEFKPNYDLVVVEPKAKHTATLIYLHGLGDSGDGWGSTFEEVAPHFPYLKVILPSALKKPVTLNSGMRMPAWYDLKGLTESSEEDTEGFQDTIQHIRNIIQNEIDEHNIPPERIVIGGFSQGGSIALYLGLTYEKKLAGVIGMSTFILQREKFAEIISKSGNLDTPVLMCHGTADQVVRYQWGKMTFDGIKKILQDNGSGNNQVQFKTYNGMGHSACQQELVDVVQFLKERVPEK